MKIRSTWIGVVAALVLSGCGSSPEAPSAVPNVVGKQWPSAIAALAQAGYTSVGIRISPNQSVASGAVVSEWPRAGARIGRGDSVVLTIYLGRVEPVRPESTKAPVSPAVFKHFAGLPPRYLMPECSLGSSQTPTHCVGWLEQGFFYLTTWGSDSCPSIPTSVVGMPANIMVIRTLTHHFTSTCSDNPTATTSIVRLPRSIDEKKPVEVQIDGTVLRLPAAPDWSKCPLCPAL